MGSCEGYHARTVLVQTVTSFLLQGVGDESIANGHHALVCLSHADNGSTDGKGNTRLSRLSDAMGQTVSVNEIWVKY